MKCPNCKSEMEKGNLATNGNLWVKVSRLYKYMSIFGGVPVYAYKCPKCGKIELTSETEK